MPWLEFFLRGVIEQGNDALQRFDALLRLWNAYRAKLQTSRTSALVLDMVDRFFAVPALSVAQTARRLGITHRAAQMNADKRVKAGILQLMPGRVRNRIYLARDILTIIEASEPKKS